MAAAISMKAVNLLGQVSPTPVRATLVWLNLMVLVYIVNIIGRAGLAALAAAIAHGHNDIATDSLTSLH